LDDRPETESETMTTIETQRMTLSEMTAEIPMFIMLVQDQIAILGNCRSGVALCESLQVQQLPSHHDPI